MDRKRLTSLDGLRGIAALSVVFWHWQHFFALRGTWQPGWTRSMQPFYWAAKPLYLQGWAAVDIFFVLSGFVFFWLYGQKLRSGEMASGRFWLLRFSRLYPLQVLLLVVTAILQAIYARSAHTSFIYQSTDAGDFLQNLLMVQAWSRHASQTFDGPAWSVSIELFLYIVFFGTCRLGLRAGWQSCLVAAFGIPLLWFDEHIARGVIGFFMGGTMYALWRTLEKTRSAVQVARALCVLVMLVWAVLLTLLWRGSAFVSGGETNAGFLISFDVLVCPLTVLALALRESTSQQTYKRIAFLGDISYATYMLHFPMQLMLVIAAIRIGLTPTFFMQDWLMAAFFACLIGLGALTYFKFEQPLQNWLRGRKFAQTIIPAVMD